MNFRKVTCKFSLILSRLYNSKYSFVSLTKLLILSIKKLLEISIEKLHTKQTKWLMLLIAKNHTRNCKIARIFLCKLYRFYRQFKIYTRNILKKYTLILLIRRLLYYFYFKNTRNYSNVTNCKIARVFLLEFTNNR